MKGGVARAEFSLSLSLFERPSSFESSLAQAKKKAKEGLAAIEPETRVVENKEMRASLAGALSLCVSQRGLVFSSLPTRVCENFERRRSRKRS